MQHLQQGELLGLTTIENLEVEGFERKVVAVKANTLADELGLKVDDQIKIHNGLDSLLIRFFKQHPDKWNDDREPVLHLDSQQQGRITIPLTEIRDRSVAVHPTQIYSAINAGLLSLFLWFYWKFRRYDGEVLALLLILYPIARFLLEIIRNDETGMFGSNLTISQWVSIGTILAGFGLLALVRAKSEPIHGGNSYNENRKQA